jgi:hypothetical protein
MTSIIQFLNISNNTKLDITSNDLYLYCNDNNLYFKNERIDYEANNPGYCTLAPFINNLVINTYRDMYLAYQNFNNDIFFIINEQINITHINLIQSSNLSTTYIIQFYNDTNQIGNDISITLNEKSIKYELTDEIYLEKNFKLKLKIKENNIVINNQEVLLLCEGYYPSQRNYSLNNSTIYYNKGNIGIGTNNPTSLLNIYNGTLKLEDNENNYININNSIYCNKNLIINNHLEIENDKSNIKTPIFEMKTPTINSNIKLYIQSDRGNNDIIFTDSSLYNHSITANGSVKHSLDKLLFGTSSIYFNGSTDYLSIANSNDFNLGSNDFTIEAWINLSSYVGWGSIVSKATLNGANPSSYTLTHHGGSKKIYFWYSTTGSGWDSTISGTTQLNLNTWYHIAVTRKNNRLRIFINGSIDAEKTLVDNYIIFEGTNNLNIGCEGTNNFINGYLDNIRITKNEALYTDNFNWYFYNGTFNSKSFSFDGIDDYFEIPTNIAPQLAGSDFTIEFWAKIPNSATQRFIFDQGNSDGTGNTSITIYIYQDDTLALNFTQMNAKVDISAYYNIWTHFSFVYTNSATNNTDSIKIYINGVSQNITFTGGQVSNFHLGTTASGPLTIGRFVRDNLHYFDGELKELRVWNSIRTQNEIQSSINTNNFISFTFPGIIHSDYYEFNGTSDFVEIPANIAPQLANSSFTIEFWAKQEDLGTNYTLNQIPSTILEQGNYTTNEWLFLTITRYSPSNDYILLLDIYGSQYINYNLSSNGIIFNTWNHYAITYDYITGIGKLYINRIEKQSLTNTNKTTANGVMYIGRNHHAPDRGYGDEYFNGELKHLRVWNSVRTESEIQSNIAVNTLITSHFTNEISSDNTNIILNIASNFNFNSYRNVLSFNGTINSDYYEFDGTDDYFEIPANISPQLAGSDFTIEFWIKIAGNTKGHQAIYNFGVLGNYIDIRIRRFTAGNMLEFSLNDRHIYYEITSYFNLWTHFAFTYDDSATTNNEAAKMYINGLLVINPLSYGYVHLGTTATGSIKIGGYPGADHYLEGELKHLRVWNNIRSESEIQNEIYINLNNEITIDYSNTNYDSFIFNGVDNFEIPANLVPQLSNSSITIEFWAYIDSSFNNGMGILYKIGNSSGNTEGDMSFGIYNSQSGQTWTFYIQFYVSSVEKRYLQMGDGTNTSVTQYLDSWHHYTIIRNHNSNTLTGNIKIYIDGIDQGLSYYQHGAGSINWNLNGSGTIGNNFKGKLKHLRIWNSVKYTSDFHVDLINHNVIPDIYSLIQQNLVIFGNFTLSNFDSNTTITNNNIINKISDNNIWNGSVHSNESYSGSAYLKFKVLRNDNHIMIGFNTDPLSVLNPNARYININYALYLDNSTIRFYNSGNLITTLSETISADDIFELIYSETTIRYYQNSILIYTTTNVSSNSTFYLDTTIYKNYHNNIEILEFSKLSFDSSLSDYLPPVSDNLLLYIPMNSNDKNIYKIIYEQNLNNYLKNFNSIGNLLLYIPMNNNYIYTSKDTFIDNSLSNHIITANSSVKNSSDKLLFGTSSIYFNGSTDYLSIPNSNDFNLDSNDFTIETLVNLTSYSNWGTFIAQSQPAGAGGSSWYFGCGDNASREGKIVFAITTDGNGWNYNESNWVSISKLNLNTWYHVAACRENDTIRLFINGTLESSYTLPSNYSIFNSPNNITIGCQQTASNGIIDNIFNGYLDIIRITKNEALYTDNINSHIYHCAINNDNYEFDGIDNYIEIPSNIAPQLAGSNFTIEFWAKQDELYATDYAQNLSSIFECGNYTTMQWLFIAIIRYKSSGDFIFHVDTYPQGLISYNLTTNGINYRTWNHYAITFNKDEVDKGTAKFYINGVLKQTLSDRNLTTASGEIYIGKNSKQPQRGYGTENFKGELKHLRIWNSVKYTSDFHVDLINHNVIPDIYSLIQQNLLIFDNFTLNNYNSNTTITNNNIINKINGGYSWNGSVYSNESYSGSAYLKLKVLRNDNHIMIGFNTHPLSVLNPNARYININYALYLDNSTIRFYNSGNLITTLSGTISTDDIFELIYSGTKIKYYQNQTLIYTTTNIERNLMFSLDINIHDDDKSNNIEILEFSKLNINLNLSNYSTTLDSNVLLYIPMNSNDKNIYSTTNSIIYPNINSYSTTLSYNTLLYIPMSSTDTNIYNNRILESAITSTKITEINNMNTFEPFSFNFNGIDDYFEIPANIAPQLAGSDFTIEFWAKITSVANRTIFSQGILANHQLLTIYCTYNRMYLDFYYGQVTFDTSSLILNNFNHYAFVYNSSGDSNQGTVLLYLNGIIENPLGYYGGNNMRGQTTASGKITIGTNYDNNSYIQGELKHLRVYNDIRTQTEIQNAIFQNNSLAIHYINTSSESFIFNGTSDFFIISADIAPQLAGSDFTIEFWAKITNTTAGTIFSQGIIANHQLLLINYTSNRIFLDFNFGQVTFDTSSLILNNFNHYAFLYNSSGGSNQGTVLLYLNGIIQNPLGYFAGTNMRGQTSASGKITIGTNYDNNSYFQGELKHLRVYNDIRTESEIQNAISNNKPNISDYSTTISNNLLLYIPMNSNDKNIYTIIYETNSSDYSKTLSNNLLLYIPMNCFDKNIYTLNSEISNNILEDEYLTDIENNLHYDNLQLYIPMNSNNKNIYAKSLIKTNINGYIKQKAVGLYANITTGFTATFSKNVFIYITNDTTYDTYHCSGIDWSLRWAYPDNNIFDRGLFYCPIDGLYKVCANIRFDSTGGPYQRLIVSINKNTDINKMLHNIQGNPSTSYETFNISGCVRLFKNDIVSLAFINAHDDINFTLSHTSSFSIVLIKTL